MEGRIHSIESMGLRDGPGIRAVVFLEGCRLRCLYCHNPDTWTRSDKSTVKTAEELCKQLSRFRSYFGQKGGVTVSGGEPLLQIEFVTELFTCLQNAGFHTCLDTAGVGRYEDENYTEKLSSLFAVTDLVLLDLKHTTDEGYQQITGHSPAPFRFFLSELQKTDIPIWIRHVVVPGLTDSEAHLHSLKKEIDKLSHVEKVELLPYHTLGVSKYEEMGIPYPLSDTPPLSKSDLEPYLSLFETSTM